MYMCRYRYERAAFGHPEPPPFHGPRKVTPVTPFPGPRKVVYPFSRPQK